MWRMLTLFGICGKKQMLDLKGGVFPAFFIKWNIKKRRYEAGAFFVNDKCYRSVFAETYAIAACSAQ